jgi:hypothetical protein
MLYFVRIALVPLTIVLLQRSLIHEFRSIVRLDLQFSASLSMEIYSDISCLSETMASDATKLHFQEFPHEALDDSQWFRVALLTAQDCQVRVRNAANENEIDSLQLSLLMEMYWNSDELIWPANEAAIAELTDDAILKHTQIFINDLDFSGFSRFYF